MNTRYVITDRFTYADGPRYGVFRVDKSQARGRAPIATPHRWYWSVDEALAEVRRLRGIDRERAAIGSAKS